MKGKILGYNKESQTGLISAEDGKRYHFSRADWQSPNEPTVHANVDFEVKDTQAVDIYRANVTLVSPDGISRKWIAALSALILGAFGVHKFYLGYQKQGIIMLMSSTVGAILFGIPTVIMLIIAFIEFIIYITKSEELFEETYITGRRPWF